MKVTVPSWNFYDFTSQDMDRRKTCVRKKPYLSYEIAEKLAKKSDISLRVYKCPYCSYFHLTKRLERKGE